jgi:hypothetical protein
VRPMLRNERLRGLEAEHATRREAAGHAHRFSRGRHGQVERKRCHGKFVSVSLQEAGRAGEFRGRLDLRPRPKGRVRHG